MISELPSSRGAWGEGGQWNVLQRSQAQEEEKEEEEEDEEDDEEEDEEEEEA